MLLLLEIDVGLTVVMSLVVGGLWWAIQAFLTNHIYICAPNEILVFTGRSRTNAQGQVVGYRVLKGGRSTRMPFVESCERLSLVPLSVQRRATFALAGGASLNLSLEAEVKIAAAEPALTRAIERFLGCGTDEVAQVAATSLEASLSEYMSRHDAESLPAKAGPAPPELLEAARVDLLALGLELKSLQLEGDH